MILVTVNVERYRSTFYGHNWKSLFLRISGSNKPRLRVTQHVSQPNYCEKGLQIRLIQKIVILNGLLEVVFQRH